MGPKLTGFLFRNEFNQFAPVASMRRHRSFGMMVVCLVERRIELLAGLPVLRPLHWLGDRRQTGYFEGRWTRHQLRPHKFCYPASANPDLH